MILCEQLERRIVHIKMASYFSLTLLNFCVALKRLHIGVTFVGGVGVVVGVP
jgi:hypothetical protein